jgi:hypothetical protein
MSRLDEDLQALLGPIRESRTILDVPAVPSAAGEGLASASPDLAPGELALAFQQEPHRRAIEVRDVPSLHLWRSVGRPSLFQVEDLEEPHAALGAAERYLDGWLLDASREAVLVVRREEGTIHLVARGGGLRIAQVWPAVSEDPVARAAERFAADTPAVVSPPDLLALAGTARLAPWLAREAVIRAGGGDGYSRLAAAGLVARLGAATAENAEDVLAGRLEGRPGPARRVVEWACALKPEALADAARALDAEAGQIVDLIQQLHRAVASGDPTSPTLALEIMRRRDDAESVAVVLRGSVAGDVVLAALRPLDALAIEERSAFEMAWPTADDPLLRAVGWLEPGAWWGFHH